MFQRRDGKVTKMSALAGLFLNTKDKAILSRFGDLRPVLLKHGGTFRNFLRHHSAVFSITEDPRMPGPGDCVVEAWVEKRKVANSKAAGHKNARTTHDNSRNDMIEVSSCLVTRVHPVLSGWCL